MWTEFDDSQLPRSVERERTIRIAGGRTLRATPVFDTFWRFATKQQQLFFARLAGPPPWTDSPFSRGIGSRMPTEHPTASVST